jgi:hypothetical protein
MRSTSVEEEKKSGIAGSASTYPEEEKKSGPAGSASIYGLARATDRGPGGRAPSR